MLLNQTHITHFEEEFLPLRFHSSCSSIQLDAENIYESQRFEQCIDFAVLHQHWPTPVS